MQTLHVPRNLNHLYNLCWKWHTHISHMQNYNLVTLCDIVVLRGRHVLSYIGDTYTRGRALLGTLADVIRQPRRHWIGSRWHDLMSLGTTVIGNSQRSVNELHVQVSWNKQFLKWYIALPTHGFLSICNTNIGRNNVKTPLRGIRLCNLGTMTFEGHWRSNVTQVLALPCMVSYPYLRVT